MKDFLYKPDTDPFHSHGIAKMVHGGSIGAGSNETYRQRRQLDGNRQHVSKYRDSLVVRHRTASVRYQSLRQDERISTATPRKERSMAPIPPRQQFSEPPARPYNPYQ